jgi:hypothetical protein
MSESMHFVLGFSGGLLLIWLACEALVALMEWVRRKRRPARYQITLTDPDGIPMRSDQVSVEGIARLIKDINAGYYK